MAYVFKLPQTVTEEIMRYAIGYPCDRLRAAANIVRTENHFVPEGRAKYLVYWFHWLEDGFRILWFKHMFSSFLEASLERDKKKRMRLLQEQCEPCEPTELELQRMYFKSF